MFKFSWIILAKTEQWSK